MFYGNTVGFDFYGFRVKLPETMLDELNKNADIHQVSYMMNLKENFMLGALAYKFQNDQLVFN